MTTIKDAIALPFSGSAYSCVDDGLKHMKTFGSCLASRISCFSQRSVITRVAEVASGRQIVRSWVYFRVLGCGCFFTVL